MKYTIYGYRQDVSFELGLYFDELAILRYFDDFRRTGKMYSEEVDGKTYYWVIYEKIAEEFPTFKLRFKDPVRKIASLMKNGNLSKVLESKTLYWNGKQKGTFSFFAINEEVYNRLIAPVFDKEVVSCKKERSKSKQTGQKYDIDALIKKMEIEVMDENEYGFEMDF